MQVGSTSNCLNLGGLTHIPPVWISKDVGSKVKVRWTKRTEEFQILNLYNIMSVLKIKVVAPPSSPDTCMASIHFKIQINSMLFTFIADTDNRLYSEVF